MFHRVSHCHKHRVQHQAPLPPCVCPATNTFFFFLIFLLFILLKTPFWWLRHPPRFPPWQEPSNCPRGSSRRGPAAEALQSAFIACCASRCLPRVLETHPHRLPKTHPNGLWTPSAAPEPALHGLCLWLGSVAFSSLCPPGGGQSRQATEASEIRPFCIVFAGKPAPIRVSCGFLMRCGRELSGLNLGALKVD